MELSSINHLSLLCWIITCHSKILSLNFSWNWFQTHAPEPEIQKTYWICEDKTSIQHALLSNNLLATECVRVIYEICLLFFAEVIFTHNGPSYAPSTFPASAFFDTRPEAAKQRRHPKRRYVCLQLQIISFLKCLLKWYASNCSLWLGMSIKFNKKVFQSMCNRNK